MASSLRPYVVKQGDYLLALATKYAFDPDSVWKDPKNAALREARKDDGNLLLPGNLLFIPEVERKWLPITVGATNTFVAPVKRVHICVRFIANGEALAGEPYVVEGADVDPGSLDGDGNFKAMVSTRVGSFRVRFTQRYEVYTIRVGDLDPVHEESGMRMRLGMLGFFGRGVGTCADEDAHLEAGLRLFQEKNKLEITGDLDDATTKKVLEAFGR